MCKKEGAAPGSPTCSDRSFLAVMSSRSPRSMAGTPALEHQRGDRTCRVEQAGIGGCVGPVVAVISWRLALPRARLARRGRHRGPVSAASATCQPADAAPSAMPRPMPCWPPVMRAVPGPCDLLRDAVGQPQGKRRDGQRGFTAARGRQAARVRRCRGWWWFHGCARRGRLTRAGRIIAQPRGCRMCATGSSGRRLWTSSTG